MSLHISRILHAGYLFESEQTRILFDPIFETPFSRNCYAFPPLRFDIEKLKKESFSAVFISHYHDDHLSLESLDHLDKNTPIYLYCIHSEAFDWLKQMGFKSVHPLTLSKSVSVGPFEISPTRALDVDVDCIFQIDVKGQKILNVIDSWIDGDTLGELAKKSPWDLVLWPFQTFRELEILSPSRHNLAKSEEIPHEFEPQIKALAPRYIVPSSCQFRFEAESWINQVYFPISYNQFKEFAKKASPTSEVRRIEPGDRFLLSQNQFTKSDDIPWIDCPVKDSEYGIKADFHLPTTGEISQGFPALTKTQRTNTLKYCTKELMERFSELPDDDAPYFNHLRVWRLSVYDSNESSLDFYYLIKGNHISLMGQAPKRFQWWTEIPLSRLHGALFEGESLSSLYARINDCIFPQDIEDDIAEFDPMWDPLLRTLYSGRFGSYQKAQLKRILKKKTAASL